MNDIIYPRSPQETMCGWMHLPRYIDKIRLHLAGKLHADYQPNFGKGFDGVWLKAAGLTHDQFGVVVKNRITDGQEIVLADEPHDLAKAVAELLTDANRREQLGDAARRRVESEYSLSALRRAVRAALGQFCDPVASLTHSGTIESRSLGLPS